MQALPSPAHVLGFGKERHALNQVMNSLGQVIVFSLEGRDFLFQVAGPHVVRRLTGEKDLMGLLQPR